MSSIEDITIIDLNSVTLDYVLDHCDEFWTDGKIAKSRYSSDVGAAVNKDIRDVETALMDEELQLFLDKAIWPHIRQYAIKNNIIVSNNVGYNLAKYSKGQFFVDHVDSTKEFPRKISAILYLNDNYEGGTLTFTKFNKTFKPKAQSLFIFPSGEDFSHSADPVIDGTKYVIVGFWS